MVSQRWCLLLRALQNRLHHASKFIWYIKHSFDCTNPSLFQIPYSLYISRSHHLSLSLLLQIYFVFFRLLPLWLEVATVDFSSPIFPAIHIFSNCNFPHSLSYCIHGPHFGLPTFLLPGNYISSTLLPTLGFSPLFTCPHYYNLDSHTFSLTAPYSLLHRCAHF